MRVGLRVRLEPLLACPVAHAVSDRVAEVGRQPAAFDLEHLVPAPRLVEAERGSVRRLRARVLELVPVVEDRLGRDDLLERRLLDPAEPAQRVLHLALLLLELHLVREILEAAAAAGGVVRARRLDALRPGREDVDRERLGVIPLHLRHARANAVSGKAATHEDDVAVQPRDAVPAVCEGLDVELDDVVTPDGSCHGTTVAAPVPEGRATRPAEVPRGGGPVALTMSSRCDWRFASIDVSCAAVSLPRRRPCRGAPSRRRRSRPSGRRRSCPSASRAARATCRCRARS